MPPFPDLSSLPPWAQVLGYSIFAASVGLVAALTMLGVIQGRKTTSADKNSGAQVAAVIVDPTALNRATASVEALNMSLIESNGIARRHADATDKLADRVDRLTDGIDRLCNEVIRSAAKLG